MMKLSLALPIALAALAACAPKETIVAPTGKGLCWYMADQPDGTIRNNKVAEAIPNIEQCAAELERMRVRFIRMGGTNHEIVGAYQGTFILLKRDGIYTAQRLKGMRYMLLQRVNGKLVVPGAVVEAVPPDAKQVVD
jgi:hypothetical protein